ncbi:Methyl-CpG-binding domain-containing protein 13 [Glycine max]|nr:Methyl-CpG-binding domain-containing protein 13 [Glycine max]
MNTLNGYLMTGMWTSKLEKVVQIWVMGIRQSKGPLAKCSILRLFMAGTSQDHPQICIEYCYIAPSGHKFYSKPEVLRYLDTVNINSNSHTSKKEKICKSNDTVEKSTIEDLPPGQIKVKIRKGSNDNRVDPDVVEKSPVEDLPPGWITEAKVRKGDTGNRKDMFYIDPVSGYVFRSKKDALRYVKSGDISTCVLKPYKKLIQDEDKITVRILCLI